MANSDDQKDAEARSGPDPQVDNKRRLRGVLLLGVGVGHAIGAVVVAVRSMGTGHVGRGMPLAAALAVGAAVIFFVAIRILRGHSAPPDEPEAGRRQSLKRFP